MYQVLYEGLEEPKEFIGLFEAFQNVVANRKQGNFLLKQGDQPWEDGTKLFQGMARMFEPA